MRRGYGGTALMAALAVLGLIGGGAERARAQLGAPKFLKASASAPTTVTPGKPFTVTVTVTIDKPYHIQANKTKPEYIPTVLEIGPVKGFKVGAVAYPKSVQARVGSETLAVYEGKVVLKATMTAEGSVKPGKVTLPFTLKYQGCNETSCFPPSKATGQATVTVGVKKTAALGERLILAQAPETPPTPKPETRVTGQAVSVEGFTGSKITQFIEPEPFVAWLQTGESQAGKADVVTDLLTKGGAGNFAGALGLIYLLGLALNLTPCVYPLIPITIGYFGRQAASGAKTGGLSVCYALGMALMYTTLGLFAALLGKGFGAQLQNPIVLIFFSAIMFALALSNFDRKDGRPIWELQLPSSLTSKAKSRTGYAGAILMGLMVGLVAAPCIGPVVVALIQVVGSTQNVPLGIVTFFTLGIGLATPYLLLGFGLIKALPRAGEWMIAVKHIFGILLFGMSLYYLRDLVGPSLYRILFTLFCLASGIYLLFLDKAGQSAVKFQRFKQIAGVFSIALGIWFFVPKGEAPKAALAGELTEIKFETPKDHAALEALLERARAEKKPVLIDFWATWCAACKELEEKTFKDAAVARAAKDHIALRFQLQEFDSDFARPFVQKFGIVGLPTVVHLVPDDGTKTAKR